MSTTDKRQVALLIHQCYQAGIENVVISPGSRNAPLIIGFQSHPDIKCFVIHDERCAAFFALGLSQSTNTPVAITCTSGSALLNYSPAIAEAYYRQTPLLVLSADRPSELIDQGDGQTMRQSNVFSNFIKKSVDLINHDDPDQYGKSKVLIEESLNNLLVAPMGPVHINIPLAEPLYGEAEPEQFPDFEKRNSSDKILDEKEIKFTQDSWSTCARKLVIIGQMPPNKKLEELVKKLAEDPSVSILVENTSNIQHFHKIIHSIDRTLAGIKDSELDTFRPDLILSFGGAIISKRIKSFLRSCNPKHNWRVGKFSIKEDTYQSLSKFYEINPESFLPNLLEQEHESLSNFGGLWKQKDFLAQDAHTDYLSSLEYSDLKVFELVLDALPESTNLHMGNSSVVRYCQLFNPVSSINYFSNRGLSGIDGSTSTAAGYAVKSNSELNVLISGDTSFFYDSNALWNPYLQNNLKIIVIRNGGGGIFQIIDGPVDSSQSETFFAPFEASVQSLCEAYNCNYLFANSLEGIEREFYKFMDKSENNRPTVFEIDTKSCANGPALKAYFEHIASRLG